MTKSPSANSDEDAHVLAGLGRGDALWRVPQTGWQSEIDPVPQGLLSGSFNPRHSGHDGLRHAAEVWIGGAVYFELPLTNADKPGLDSSEAADRCRQFQDRPLLVTRAATFVEKARILPRITFVVGVDTAVRVVAPRFYGDRLDPQSAPAAMRAALAELRELECRFLVAARSQQGRVLRLSDVTIPAEFRDLFTELPVDRFRVDVSSSELRRRPDRP